MKQLFILITFCLIFAESNAQNESKAQGNEGSATDVSVEIISEKGRPLSKARRIAGKPEIKDTLTPKPNFDYTNQPAFVKTEFSPEIIKAPSLKIYSGKEKLDRGYVRAGIGLYTTPLFDFYFTEGYNKYGTYGVKAHHFSSQGGVKGQGYPGFSDNSIGVFGKYFTRKLEVGGALDYERNVVHYYGYNGDSVSIAPDDIKQRFNKVTASAYLGTFTPDSFKLNHREKIEYQYTDDKFKAMENRIMASTSLSKVVNRELYGFNFIFDYNNFVPTFNFPGCIDCLEQGVLGSTQNNALVTLNPNVKSVGENWNLKVGLLLTGDFYNSGAKFHFYPDVEFRYSLFNDIFVPYVGINGGMQRNNYRSLATQNPFTISNIELLNTNNKVNIFGGIRGTISSTTSFNAQVSYLKTENMPLFYNDTLYSIQNKFNIDYDSVDVFNISGQIHYRQTERLKIFLRGDYFSYKTTNALYAWNLPNFKVTMSGVYDMADKIIIRADFFVVGSRQALSLTPVDGIAAEENVYPVKLKPYFDLNLGAEYRFNKKMSAFMNLYNLAGQKYQNYLNYTSQNINVIFGLTASF